jgi:hypothetical protein
MRTGFTALTPPKFAPGYAKLLGEGAAAREYTMRFVRVPELTARPALVTAGGMSAGFLH